MSGPADSAPVTVSGGDSGGRRIEDRIGWLVSPGPLAPWHRDLNRRCSACHVPFAGVASERCAACHAATLASTIRPELQFHAGAPRCLACHQEHTGESTLRAVMDHKVLADSVVCTACHVDRHQAMLGSSCRACHGTDAWAVAGYTHPSERSFDCAECHQPPPSHLMEHFDMVDRRLTGQLGAKVEECWRCHLPNHWNQIRGLGFYKHH